MKLYFHEGVWQLPGCQTKGAIKIDVPIAAAALATFLNDRNVVADPEPTTQPLTDAEQVEINRKLSQEGPIIFRRDPPFYASPLDASSTIAGIDAGMCAAAIRQMEGANLAKIASACIERISQVSFDLRCQASEGTG